MVAENLKEIYDNLEKEAKKTSEEIILAKGKLFYSILEKLPPHLTQENAKVPLESIYDAGYHKKTGFMFVCNKGAYLIAKTPKTGKYYATAHIGFLIYAPKHGIETVDVGIVGDITKGDFIIVRPESACSSSFIIGSQRCNCYDQWILVKELAALHNPLKISKKSDAVELEEFISNYFKVKERVPVPKNGGLGFIFIHMASQNGMGSGAIEGKFSKDLTSTAYIRHRGEYTAEQVHRTSLAGGFTSLGLTPDPRTLNDRTGYKIPSVILDYFNISKPLVALTNNQEKVKALKDLGFDVYRVQFLGRSDALCGVETKDRREEFLHKIPPDLKIDIDGDIKLVDREIHKIFGNKHNT